MYKLNKSIAIGQITSIVKEENGVTICIPFAPDNTDYQAYLKWLEEGNEPEPADE
jgi:hypothetical protein